MSGSENSRSIDYYKKKYFPMESMCVFQDCRIHFYEMPIVNKDLKIVSDLYLRRMRLEITMRGGEVCENLLRATHLVAYSIFGSHNFDELYKRFPSAQRLNLHDNRLHVVMHQWLDDSLGKGKKLLEDAYNLKPETLEELNIDERMVLCLICGRAAPKPYQRTETRTSNRAAKINSNEPENNDSIDESDGKQADEPMEETHVSLEKHESSKET